MQYLQQQLAEKARGLIRWVSWNTGRGWAAWHRTIGPQPIRAACGREIPQTPRVCWTEKPEPEKMCRKCRDLAKPSMTVER